MLAIEKLMGLEVPLRAQYIRVLMAELTRISNHMLQLGSHIMDVGAMTPNLWLFEVREDTMQFYERASGARMHANYFRPGGVRYDLPPKLLADMGDWLDNRLQLFEDAIALVADNRIFKQRNVDIAVMSQEDSIAWGFSGPDDPRRRASVGPAQVAALRGLRPDGFRGAGGHPQRLLRPLHGPGRGSAAVGEDHAPVPRPDAVRAGRDATTARCSRRRAPR